MLLIVRLNREARENGWAEALADCDPGRGMQGWACPDGVRPHISSS